MHPQPPSGPKGRMQSVIDIDDDDDEPVEPLVTQHQSHPSQQQQPQQQDQHQRHGQHGAPGYSKQEKRRRMLERELRDLQAEFPSPNILSREERRTAAAEAAKARMAARSRDGQVTGKTRGRGRMPILYDDQGVHMKSGQDVCDCLDPECVGCHFPCKGCGSNKCGRKCRVHRKWIYTQVIEQLPYDESIILRTKKV